MKHRNALRVNPVVVAAAGVAVVVVVVEAADHAAGKRRQIATLPEEPVGEASRHSPHFFELRDDVDGRRIAGF
jgi:hypothetical protein